MRSSCVPCTCQCSEASISTHAVPPCPRGQTYKCGPPVPPSCDNPTGVDGVCVDGCFCNDGTVLNNKGQCVRESQCGSKSLYGSKSSYL